MDVLCGDLNGTAVRVDAAVRQGTWAREPGPVTHRTEPGADLCGVVRYVGCTAHPDSPDSPLEPAAPPATIPPMSLIAPARQLPPRRTGAVIVGTLVGSTLVFGGLSLAYLAFATPLLSIVAPVGRASAGQMALGMAAWSVALVAPAGFVIVGVIRLARSLETVRLARPTRTQVEELVTGMPADVALVRGLTVDDSDPISDLALGPFGMVVIAELPPMAHMRHDGAFWEVRTRRGWVPMDDPFDRADRDMDRTRRWLESVDLDFVVKVYAVVVDPTGALARTPTCAVIAPDRLTAWLGSLPAQRGLTHARLEGLRAAVREAVV